MKLDIKIAVTYLKSGLKQTVAALLSVMFGISMYVFINSFMGGVNDSQAELVFSGIAHIRIYNDLPPDRSNVVAVSDSTSAVNVRNPRIIQYVIGIKNTRPILDVLSTNKSVVAVASEVNENVFLRNGASQLNGNLAGVDVVQEDNVFGMSNFMVEGDWGDIERRLDGIIIGAGVAYKLSLKMNDYINLTTTTGTVKNYKVVGIFKTAIVSIDNAKVYMRISAVRELLSNNRDYVTDIQVDIDKYRNAMEVARELAPFIPWKVESWEESNGQLATADKLRTVIAVSVSIVILVVAGFGIYNIMSMTVNERIKEIAILKAIGFESSNIKNIFLSQAIIIGVIGGFMGLLMGYGAAAGADRVPFESAVFDTLPMGYEAIDYVMAFAFALLTNFLAGYIPARKASRLDPISILRG